MDNLTKEQRKRNMQNIRSQDTMPEKLVARELRKRQIYYTSNVKKIVGKPDFVFRRRKVAVFIDSDFWHGHPKRGIMPKTNKRYWTEKIANNKRRDRRVTQKLKVQGWKVIRIWEYDVKRRFDKAFERIERALQGN